MDQKLLLITGMAHSGTTILQRAVKQHQRINGPIKESNFLVGRSNDLISIELANFSRDYADSLVIVEKTPVHLWFYESLCEVHPQAKMLVIIRDGKDVVASQYERFGRYYSITRGANHWADSAHKAITLSLHYPSQVKIVRYEHLVGNYKSTMSEVFKFIDVDDSEYDYGLIHEESAENFLSENEEKLDCVILEKKYEDISISSDDSSMKHENLEIEKNKVSYNFDDEINIIPYRKLQVAAPLFDGSGKSKRLSEENFQKMQMCTRFSSMMRFMGYSI